MRKGGRAVEGARPATGGGKLGKLMHTVYILQNESKKYYIGCTNNLERRLLEHNSGESKSTKNRGLWTVLYKEHFEKSVDAYEREKKIKSYKGGRAFKKLIGQ